MEFDRLEALRVGQELKKIRKQRGLSLAEVEALSAGRWKAVVVGSYERADRAITVGRLSSLMALYQAPISAIFPSGASTTPSTRAITASPSADVPTTPWTINLGKRQEISSLSYSLAQFITHIINARGDWNGHVLTLRQSDLELIAICDGVDLAQFTSKLQAHRFLALLR
jgi:transcriptional regulator with XRE-family HTH domain